MFNNISHIIQRNFFVFLYLLVVFFILNIRTNFNWIFYIILLAIVLPSIIEFIKIQTLGIKLSGMLFLVSFILYGYFSLNINQIELWGDEIGVIKGASLAFQDTAGYVASHHAASPPLDIWNMWFWKNVVERAPLSIHELLYRAPYMLYHTLAAILFASLVDRLIANNKNQVLRAIIVTAAFIVYFSNPLLFFYSIEVRFYGLTALGTVIVLYLYFNSLLYKAKFLPLLLLLGLNSVFHYLLLLPFIFIGIIFRANKSKIIVLLVSHLALLFLLWHQLNIPSPVSSSSSLHLIGLALKQFLEIQYSSLFQLLVLFAIFFICSILQGSKKEFFTTLFVLLICIVSISVLGYQKRYFDFHVRHYLFLVPLTLYLLFFPLKKLLAAPSLLYICILLIVFTIPWIGQVFFSLQTRSLFSKSLIDAKAIAREASREGESIIITNGDSLSSMNYQFYLQTLVWYANRYGVISYTAANAEEGCRYFKNDSRMMIVSPADSPVRCDEGNNDPVFRYGSAVFRHVIGEAY